jgi:hypothetical protein
MEYENRIICFLDILGFQRLINRTINPDGSDNISEIQTLTSALNNIREFTAPNVVHGVENTKVVTQFSDCIAFSFLITEESGIFSSLLEIQWICLNLVYKKILCRGGIAVGKLIHTTELLFGPALIDAYKLESQCANYPRVILPETIIDLSGICKARHHTPEQEKKYVMSCLGKDSDGMYYVDYFSSIQSELDNPYYDYPEYLYFLSEIIADGLQATDIAISSKYLWMKEKYNQVVKGIKENLPHDNIEPEIEEAYNSLPLF